MFEFSVPTRINFGQGVLDRVGDLVGEYGERIFLVTDGTTTRETGYLSKVKKLLEDVSHGVLLFDKVYSDSDSDVVNKGADQAIHAKCDCIVGFGGRTTLHTAKAIAFLVSNGGILEDYFLGRKGEKKTVSYIEIPTNHGIFPGVTNSFYILDKYDKVKKNVNSPKNYADLLIMDPKITTTIPDKFNKAIGCEILSVAIESYISKASSPISDAFAVKTIEIIGQNLVKSVQDPENLSFRTNLCSAGVMASLGIANSAFGTCSALALALKSYIGTYQGFVSTILLPHVMEFNLTASPNRYVQIAKGFGENVSDITVIEAAIKAIEFVRKILFDLKTPQRLSELDVDKDDLFQVAKIAKSYDFLHYLPRAVSKEDMHNILISAY